MTDFAKNSIHMLACEYNLRYNDIRLACFDAGKKGVNALLLMPKQIPTAKAESGSVKLIAVCAYPAGCQPLVSKECEIHEAVELGADEIYLIPTSGYVLDDQWDLVEAELRGCKEAAGNAPITLMLERKVFDEVHAEKLCKLTVSCGYQGIATSAGFSHNSIFSVTDPLALATLVRTTEPEVVKEIRSWIGDEVKIVAVDALLDAEKAEALLNAGADYIAAPTILDLL